MIVKIVSCGILIVLCAVLGVKLTEKQKTRLDLFFELEQFLMNLSSEIGVFRVKMTQKVRELPPTLDKIFGAELKKTVDGESFELKDKRFDKDETEFIKTLFLSLGRFDESEQKKQINFYIEKLKLKIESEEKKYQKIADLYLKLGALSGLAIFIIIC